MPDDHRAKIRAATHDDIDAIVAIARSVQLSSSIDTSRGFLISAFPRDIYSAAIDAAAAPSGGEHVVVLVAEATTEVTGFLYGYNRAYALAKTIGQAERDIASRVSGPFYVLKQIAAEAKRRQGGVGRQLLERFLQETGSCDVYAAIVADPPNPASNEFHRRMGFEPTFASISRNAIGGVFPNILWRRHGSLEHH